jgi:hypothetical protein
MYSDSAFRMFPVWTPARFLLVAGTILTVIGSTGAAGLLGRVSTASVFHPPSWINWLHFSVGLTVIPIALLGTRQLQRRIVMFPAIVGTALGVLGLASGPLAGTHVGPDASDLSDHITHLCVGAGAHLALWNTRA